MSAMAGAGAQAHQHQRPVYLGSYDPEKRKQDVNRRLEQAFNEIRKMNIPEMVLNKGKQEDTGRSWMSNPFKSQDKKEPQDIITMQLNEIITEVEALEADIRKFPRGSCSNKEYDIMEGHCGKLITDLDNLEVCVSGREKLRQKRREVLKQIQELAHLLGSKIHKEGEYCKTKECYKSKN